MPFQSILFPTDGGPLPTLAQEPPACFPDLNLDQVVEAVTYGREQYDLKPYFFTPLGDAAAVNYRHDVLRDLEDEAMLAAVTAFANGMRAMREHLEEARKHRYGQQVQRWFLDAVTVYTETVSALARDLESAAPGSMGLRNLRQYLKRYVGLEDFASLVAEAAALAQDLSSLSYAVIIKGLSVQVRRYADEEDYSRNVLATFERFRQGAVKDYRIAFREQRYMSHVEALILERVARLFPEVFGRLDAFCSEHADYLDETIGLFDREIQFYLAYLEVVEPLRKAGLSFCRPRVSGQDKSVSVTDGFDLALAQKLRHEGSVVVTNDFHLSGQERIIVVTGPNQGGKTTFARMFGQLHYLASLGLPVPGSSAQLVLFDRIYTHFGVPESILTLRGKLEDDLVRIRRILDSATPRSILVLNEIFSATTLHDAVFLGTRVMERIDELDVLCVWVTFVDELASWSEHTVSMVSTVVPDNPAERTFNIVRKPADGLAFALSIADRHRVTYGRLKERLSR